MAVALLLKLRSEVLHALELCDDGGVTPRALLDEDREPGRVESCELLVVPVQDVEQLAFVLHPEGGERGAGKRGTRA